MEIINDDIDLTGERVITVDTGNSVVKYITFTASSVSEESDFDITSDAEETYEASVSLVKCTRDEGGKTYAIKIECPFFSVNDPSKRTRNVIVDGYVYTNSSRFFSVVHEELAITGCLEYNE